MTREIEQRLGARAGVAGGHSRRSGSRSRRSATVTAAAIATVRRMMSRLARLGQQLDVGARAPLVDDLAGELVEAEEALGQQREQRAEIDDAEPQQRRQQQEQASAHGRAARARSRAGGPRVGGGAARAGGRAHVAARAAAASPRPASRAAPARPAPARGAAVVGAVDDQPGPPSSATSSRVLAP